jgi:hypothetical protein
MRSNAGAVRQTEVTTETGHRLPLGFLFSDRARGRYRVDEKRGFARNFWLLARLQHSASFLCPLERVGEGDKGLGSNQFAIDPNSNLPALSDTPEFEVDM